MFVPQNFADDINFYIDEFIELYLNNKEVDLLCSKLTTDVLDIVLLAVGVKLKHTNYYNSYLEDFSEYFNTSKQELDNDITEVEQEYLLKSKQLYLEQLL
jgi:hypothetical protein